MTRERVSRSGRWKSRDSRRRESTGSKKHLFSLVISPNDRTLKIEASCLIQTQKEKYKFSKMMKCLILSARAGKTWRLNEITTKLNAINEIVLAQRPRHSQ